MQEDQLKKEHLRMEFNDSNTSFEDIQELINNLDLVKSRKTELVSDINEAISEIPFISNLISEDRRSVVNLPRDDSGRVVVDVSNPHKLENMDYFCETRNHFEKYGVYTKLYPNSAKGSAYHKFWTTEKDRILNGMSRPDGEWIPGSLYYYWNYGRIDLTISSAGGKRAERKEGFPFVWLGDYLWYHYLEQARNEGSHATLLKMRGVGASFKAGADSTRKAIFYKKSKFFLVASNSQYLDKDGVLDKAWFILDFMALNTPFPRLRTRDTSTEKIIAYKDPETGATLGNNSIIMGVSVKDDPHKVRGKRGDITFEEHGVFPNIRDTWNTCRDSVEDGNLTFGLMIAMGTGGTSGANFEGAEDMFRHPESYNIHGIPNMFDRNSDGRAKCGFFWGAYLNRSNCYDSNGNPDVIKALYELVCERVKIKYASSDSKQLTQRKAEKPLTPDECVLSVDSTVFPVGEIKDYLTDAELNLDKFLAPNKTGEIIIDSSGNCKFVSRGDLYPIRVYPLKSGNTKGAIEIFDMPKATMNGRYILGVDPIDDDYIKDGSLASVFVFDLIFDKIVAEYTGRPQTADEFFEICLKLARFYGGMINYENNKKGLFGYLDKKHSLHYLADTPKHLKDTELVKSFGHGNRSKGTPANAAVNTYARRLLADWLITEKSISNGDETKTVMNLHTIKSITLLKELKSWSPDCNADRVSAMGMVMIMREEKQKYIAGIGRPGRVKKKIYSDPLLKRFDKFK